MKLDAALLPLLGFTVHPGKSINRNHNLFLFFSYTLFLAGVSISRNYIVCSESGASEVYSVVLLSKPAESVTIYLTKDLADNIVTLSTSTITFTSGNWDDLQSVTVSVSADFIMEDKLEGMISHTLTSSDSLYSTANPQFQPSSDIKLIVYDDDLAFVLIQKISEPLMVAENSVNAQYSVKLGSEPTHSVTITIDNGDGAGFIGTSEPTLVLDSSTWSDAQPVALHAVVDAIWHDPISYDIIHTSASSDANYNGPSTPFLLSDTISVLRYDESSATVQFSATHLYISESGNPSSASSTVVLTSQPTHDVTLTLDAAALNGRATCSPLVFTFKASDWDDPQSVTITIVDDDEKHQEYISVAIVGSVTSSDAHYHGNAAVFVPFSSLNVVIYDNDYAGLHISQGYFYMQEGTSTTYSMHLNSSPTHTVTVDITTSSRTTATPNQVTFYAGNWQNDQDIILHAVADDIAHPGVSETITHYVTSTDPAYEALTAIWPTNPLIVDIIDTNQGIIYNYL